MNELNAISANINEEDKIQSWLLVAVTVSWNDLEVETSWIVGLIKAGSGDGYNCTVNKKNKGNKYYGVSTTSRRHRSASGRNSSA